MQRALLILILLLPLAAGAHSLTKGTPFANGLDHFRTGDYEEAHREWLKGSEEGESGSQFGLGLLYYTGKGVDQDYAIAYDWMRMAAERGNFNAQNNLGVMFMQGHGVEKDVVQAFAWYSVAASQGQRDAQKNVDILTEQLSPSELAEADILIAEIKANHLAW